MEQFTKSQVASGMPQQAILRESMEGFSQFVSVFIEASQNCIFYFLYKKAAKNV
jgi:hypothetical protein